MNPNKLNGNTRNSLLTALVLAVAGTGLALPAAADSTEPLQKTVSFADLDLSKPEGAATLYGRLRQAAKQVCGGDPVRRGEKSSVLRAAWRACYDQALSNAVARIDRPTLTAYHQAETGIVSGQATASVSNQK